MAGNLQEWAGDYWEAGVGTDPAISDGANPWPTGFGADGTRGVNGSCTTVGRALVNGAPAAAGRGGFALGGTASGIFAYALSAAPSYVDFARGARCCLRGR